MSVSYYMDVQVARAITSGLRLRGVDVLTAQEDGNATLPDPELLDRALALGRVTFTHDEDFLREAARRQQMALPFTGVIYAHQLNLTIGQCVRDLELIDQLEDTTGLGNQVTYLPLS